jgi:hypothetical protein
VSLRPLRAVESVRGCAILSDSGSRTSGNVSGKGVSC